MIQSGFTTNASFDEEYEGMDSGWVMCNAVLKHYLEKFFDQKRSTFLEMIPATFEYRQTTELFQTAAGLGKWLGKVQSYDQTAKRYRIEIEDGTTMEGRILATTDREVALSCANESVIVELKAFSMGPSRFLSIRGNAWGEDGERNLAKLKPVLVGQLGQLKAMIDSMSKG